MRNNFFFDTLYFNKFKKYVCFVIALRNNHIFTQKRFKYSLSLSAISHHLAVDIYYVNYKQGYTDMVQLQEYKSKAAEEKDRKH